MLIDVIVIVNELEEEVEKAASRLQNRDWDSSPNERGTRSQEGAMGHEGLG